MTTTRPTILLFDIDGTLLASGGAGRRAMEHAFIEICGSAAPCRGFSFAGMTDRAIVRLALTTAAMDTSPAAIDAIMAAYLTHLDAELVRADDFRVLPGVLAALSVARERPRLALGLGTGNVRRGAMAKLRRGAIDGHFGFGGFGCDDEARPELIRIGAERGAAALGLRLQEARVVVIGDTPLDVAAARAIGADSIGVATGRHSVSELQAAGATYAFATLEADGALAATLGTA